MGITQLNALSLSKTRIANLSLTLLKQAEAAANHIAAIPLHKHNYTEVFLCTDGAIRLFQHAEAVAPLFPGFWPHQMPRTASA